MSTIKKSVPAKKTIVITSTVGKKIIKAINTNAALQVNKITKAVANKVQPAVNKAAVSKVVAALVTKPVVKAKVEKALDTVMKNAQTKMIADQKQAAGKTLNALAKPKPVKLEVKVVAPVVAKKSVTPVAVKKAITPVKKPVAKVVEKKAKIVSTSEMMTKMHEKMSQALS